MRIATKRINLNGRALNPTRLTFKHFMQEAMSSQQNYFGGVSILKVSDHELVN